MSNIAREPEFEQALNELTSTLAPFLAQNPEYKKALEVVQIPERIIQFRVLWEDDEGNVHANRGFRVQFNSALGPYKGGLRLHPSVNLSILKFLGFEQIFKNALTGLMMGGGKGGSDFDPKGRSDSEIRRFCQSFMAELSRHIGPLTDVPAGDIGVGGREVGFLFGAYKKHRNEFSGILTGKGLDFGGSHIRPEATGYGLVYYVSWMIKHAEGSSAGWTGKKVLISGSGNVAQYAALKVIELGGVVLTLSDSKGALLSTSAEGFTPDDIAAIGALKLKHKTLKDFLDSSNGKFTYHAGARPWTLVEKADVALPSATQNEVSEEEAKALLKAGVKYIAEGSNMGCTQEAIDVFEASRAAAKVASEACWLGPAKAANAGGVAVSGLEMSQNSARIQWTREEVDEKLSTIMENCYNDCFNTARKYAEDKDALLPSLVAGANTAGFIKVADAMKAQGDWW
ncbi:glutamate dehydrogenase (nadp) [Phaffia rhodozyma]|uniref:Glutamate dehydrogenase n=3 Tax=Phaffia TaxID=107449 RepID=C6EVR5_PHARH|nr:glutamate dehydrogenase [Phaffia rhodozyma]CED85618.1 glutamate dehydrogenase (nadp) [Phaffia rhodozyma]